MAYFYNKQQHLLLFIFKVPMTASAPQISAEIFSIPLADNRYLIYAPLRRTAFVANAGMVNFMATIKDGGYDKTVDPNGAMIDFLRQVKLVDSGTELPPDSTTTGKPLPTAVTLLLTTACNLRCNYCYASAGDTKAKFMSLDVAKRGIDYIATNATKINFIAKYTNKPGVTKLGVYYHGGGEPSAHWSVLTDSFAYAKQKAKDIGLPVKGTMTSNGVLSDNKIDWIIANFDKITISFDGLPSIQDQQRPTAGGRGSSEAIMHTLRRFDAAGFPYTIRITATFEHMDQLPESVAFIGEHFKPLRIKVEPTYPVGRGQQAPSAISTRFTRYFRAARAISNKLGLTLTYSPIHVEKLSNHFCGITQDAFTLSADGNVSACHSSFSEDDKLAEVFFYGKPKAQGKGYVFDMPVLENLRSWAVRHHDFCQGCFAKWHCAGDCYYNTLNMTGRGKFTGTERCHVTRELTQDEILDRIAASGGLFWHDPIDD